MERISVDGYELTLTSPIKIDLDQLESPDEAFLKTVCRALDGPDQVIPYLRAQSLKDALNVLAIVASRRKQPLYIAPSVDQLTAMVPTLAATSSVMSAGTLPSAMIKGGLLVIPDLSNGEPDSNLLTILMGKRHIDIPELGVDLEAEEGFRIIYCSPIYTDDEKLPTLLAAFLSSPIDVPALTSQQTINQLQKSFPESAKVLLEDIAELLKQAQSLGRVGSIQDGESLARELFNPDRHQYPGRLAATARPLFGDDIANMVEDQKLLQAFHDIESKQLLDQLKKELESED
jgi:hypothetical protein